MPKDLDASKWFKCDTHCEATVLNMILHNVSNNTKKNTVEWVIDVNNSTFLFNGFLE